MYLKKVVFIERVQRKPNDKGNFEWLVSSANNFFFYSPRPLELNCWYEIIYYRAETGAFRISNNRLISIGQSRQPQIQLTQKFIQQNIFLMNESIIEVIDKDFKTFFFLNQYRKYVTHSCPSGCWAGKFCNNCWDLSNKLKSPTELISAGNYVWKGNKVSYLLN